MSAVKTPNRQILDPLRLVAEDVNGTQRLNLEIDGHTLTKAAALTVAEAMELPMNSPWALRDEATARMLVDDEPLGSQVDQDSRLTVVPKSHLG